MSNGRLNWTNSTPDPISQRPLKGTRIESRVSEALPWTEIAFVAVGTTTLLIQDLASGDWQFRGIEVDNAGVDTDNPKLATLKIPFDPPSGLVTFEAALE